MSVFKKLYILHYSLRSCTIFSICYIYTVVSNITQTFNSSQKVNCGLKQHIIIYITKILEQAVSGPKSTCFLISFGGWISVTRHSICLLPCHTPLQVVQNQPAPVQRKDHIIAQSRKKSQVCARDLTQICKSFCVFCLNHDKSLHLQNCRQVLTFSLVGNEVLRTLPIDVWKQFDHVKLHYRPEYSSTCMKSVCIDKIGSCQTVVTVITAILTAVSVVF